MNIKVNGKATMHNNGRATVLLDDPDSFWSQFESCSGGCAGCHEHAAILEQIGLDPYGDDRVVNVPIAWLN